jgi:PAS domain S-box-containing protein
MMARSKARLQEERDELLPFERLLFEISTLFITLPADEIDNEIAAALRRTCETLDLDRATLWVASEADPGMLVLTHIHQPPAIPQPPARMNTRDYFPWTARKVMAGGTLVISKMAELPTEADHDREAFSRYGTKSGVYLPLSIGQGPVFGILTFAVTREERNWSGRLVRQLELIAQIFANALSRKHAEKSLNERLRFEMLLADISTRFVALSSGQVDGAIEEALRRICENLGLDLCALWQWSADQPESLILTQIHRSREGPPIPRAMDAREFFPWSRGQMAAGNIIAVSSMAELPAEAARDAESYRYFGIKSTCVFPLAAGDAPPIGALGFNSIQAERPWPETLVKRLQLVAHIITSALARERVYRELVNSERQLRMITNALPVLISYVGADLRYRFNNEAYREWFGIDPVDASGRTIREVAGEGFFQSARPYIERALSGEQVRCAMDVELADGRPLSVEAVYVPDVGELGVVRGLYVMVLDVTERNAAWQESRRLQNELFHVGRVATMGELAGTLAHEINQPLSAIMSNAQAARRYLAGPSPDLDEVKEILEDIVKENARASAVIHRIRALLNKEAVQVEAVNLNSVFREVVSLLEGDATRGDTQISLELDPQLPAVQGDRVQLQQVALNLVLNAIEAMSRCPGAAHRVRIRTWQQNSDILAAVTDSGEGLPAGAADAIFEAFYTTKPHGLGMGLSICRSIITRHHGRLWVENNPDRGATFYFHLPAAAT